MKKTILLAVLLVGMTSTAFAAQTFTSTAGSTIGFTLFKTSTKVTLISTSTSTSYSAAAKHEQGTTCFKSSDTAATIDESTTADGYKGDVITDVNCTGVSA